MSHYSNAESAAERYFHLVASLEFPRSTHPSAPSVCARCGGGPSTIKPGEPGKRGKRKKPDTEVCSSCRAPWVARDLRDALRTPTTARCYGCGGTRIGAHCGSCRNPWIPESRWRKMTTRRQHVRPGVVDQSDQRTELMRLRPVFEPRPRAMTVLDWRQHRLCLAAQHAKGLSVADIVRHGPKAIARAPRGWTEDVVRGALERIKRIVEDRLREEGLWGGPWLARWDERGGGHWRRPRSYSAPRRSQNGSG